VAIVLAAGAAFLSALAVVLQRVALESAPAGSSFSPRLMTHALRKRGWLTGFGLMLCMFVLQASALRSGQLIFLVMTALLHHGGWVHVLGNWDPYALGLTGACGLFLVQSALHAGPIAASRTTSVIVNPLASIVIGVTAFGERLRPGPGFVTLDVLALTVMCAGVVVLIRSPLVGGLSGIRSDEYPQCRSHRGRAHGCGPWQHRCEPRPQDS
jgi:hypothetical protein